ncbi:MAG TPA: hypothetical protein PKD84_11590 [Propionicimonas sp.]|jgi:hypothetical protein|nr:hypothetical protein [Propionicimonas sp.]
MVGDGENTALEALSGASGELRQAEANLDHAVVQARRAGASWASIGQAIGISRQAAHERWGHLTRGGCQRADCDCPSHEASTCPCGHGPGRGHRAG